MMGTAEGIYPDIELVFLRALNYPDFARPEYFIREQMKSGWSKGIFLHTLMGMHDHFVMRLHISANGQRSKLKKENMQLPEDFGLDLEKESKGEVKGILTKKILEDLRYSIVNAYRIGRPGPVFDSYQVIAMCERMFIYIRSQFNEQIQKTGNARLVAERQRKEGQTVNGVPEYIIYHYNIISEAPVIDFNRFRNEVRKLLLDSINPEELKTMLQPLYVLGIEIVELWNNKLQPIEVAPNEAALKKVIHDQKLITFDADEWVIWTHNIYSPENYYREPSKYFLNQDFAGFAAKVANFISVEVLKKNNANKDQKAIPKEYDDFDDLFIDHFHVMPCYAILKDMELVGDKGNYIGNLKSAFCVWAKELIIQKIIINVPDQVLTKLLNNKFPGLEMANSNFRSNLTKARREYKPGFSKTFKLLSQPSQV